MAYPFHPRCTPHNHGLGQEHFAPSAWSPSIVSPSSCSDESLLDFFTEEIRPHCCPFPDCGRRFKRRYTLKDHIKSHTGEKPFVCPVLSCLKRFSTSGNLARHKRLHPWLDTPLYCLVDHCGCVFPNEEKLQRHMMTHFGDSSMYRCKIGTCGKVFTTVGNLRRHIKQSHDETTTSYSTPGIITPPPMVSPPTPDEHTLQYCNRYSPHQSPARDLHQSQAAMERTLPTDCELLEALSCLFDDEPTPTGTCFDIQF